MVTNLERDEMFDQLNTHSKIVQTEAMEDRKKMLHYIFPRCCKNKRRNIVTHCFMLLFTWELWFVLLTIFELILLFMDVKEIYTYLSIIYDSTIT